MTKILFKKIQCRADGNFMTNQHFACVHLKDTNVYIMKVIHVYTE